MSVSYPTNFILKTILIAALFLSLPGLAWAEGDVPSQHEQDLLQLINQARENPLAMASSLGMDTDQILKDLPDMQDILEEGLPPLIFNDNLYVAASAHTEDMLANSYYSHDSLDGRTCDDRIIESGYAPVVTGESLGMLGFTNFIAPAEAVDLIFENIFRDELNPARTEKRNILDPDLEEVGIALGSGTFRAGGFLFNVYLVTCDFATSAISVLELELLELINQARENPLAMASSLGMDQDQILEDLPELRDILTEGLPPLTFNGNLYAAASAHSRDMLENCYFSYTSLDGRTCYDRITENGYLPLITGEAICSLASSDLARPVDGARMLFEARFKDELDPARIEERNILNPQFKDAGISFRIAILDQGEELSNLYNLLACDFGTDIIQEKCPVLTGMVYKDLDQDGLYSLGEGTAQVPVFIEGPGTSFNLLTNHAGVFTVRLEPGVYQVLVYLADQARVESVEMQDANKAVWFRVE